MSRDVTSETTPRVTPEVTDLSGGEQSSGKVSGGRPLDHTIEPSAIDWSEADRILASETKFSDQ